MAQHDYVIANQGFPAFRSDLNDALAAVVSNNSGATEPTTMFAHQIWVDTAADPSILKIRNADNDAWITIGTINQTADTFTLTSAVSATTLNTSGAVVFNDAGADVDFRVEGDTEANLLFVDASTDRIGVGTSTPGFRTVIKQNSTGAIAQVLQLENNAAIATGKGLKIGFGLGDNEGSTRGYIEAALDASNGTYMAFATNDGATGTYEAFRVDRSGNLLVGKTASNTAVAGVECRSDGTLVATRDGDNPVVFRRLTSDGNIVAFQKDGTTVGAIGTSGGALSMSTPSNFLSFFTDSDGDNEEVVWDSAQTGGTWRPGTDNLSDIGYAARRWDDIYATNGTIQTSDANEKQNIEALSEAETRVAVAAKGLLKKYRWKSAVAEKGDDARIHFGIIAQDLRAAFEAEGLDAGRYAMFIHSEWWEHEVEVPAVEAQEAVLDDEGNVVQEAVEGKEAYTRTDTYETEAEAPEGAVRKERMGIRYNELLAFIIAAI